MIKKNKLLYVYVRILSVNNADVINQMLCEFLKDL